MRQDKERDNQFKKFIGENYKMQMTQRRERELQEVGFTLNNVEET